MVCRTVFSVSYTVDHVYLIYFRFATHKEGVMRQSQNVETKIPLFIIIFPINNAMNLRPILHFEANPCTVSCCSLHDPQYITVQYIPILYPHHYWNTPEYHDISIISLYHIVFIMETLILWVLYPQYITISLYHYWNTHNIMFSYPPNIDGNSGAPLRASRISASNLHQTMKTSCTIILRSFTSPSKNQKQMGLIPENHRKTPVKKTKSGVWTQRFQDMI